MTRSVYQQIRRLLILEGTDPARAGTRVNRLRMNALVDPKDVLREIKSDRAKRRLNLRGDLADRRGEQ